MQYQHGPPPLPPPPHPPPTSAFPFLPPSARDPAPASCFPFLSPNPPPSSPFWTNSTVNRRLNELHETLNLAKSMRRELELLIKVKESNGSATKEGNATADGFGSVLGFCQFIELHGIDIESQARVSTEAANAMISRLKVLIEPFRAFSDDASPWEEKSAVIRLGDRIRKIKRNKGWRKRKRKRMAEAVAKERDRFDELDQQADEWRAREIAKDVAQRKINKMKEIAKQKAKEEKKRLEAELELLLIVEKLQELRSIRIEKLKKQGHFLPDEDDKFLEKVRAAVEEEERQARVAADTHAAKEAIASAEESRKVSQEVGIRPKDHSSKNDNNSTDQETHTGTEVVSHAATTNEIVKPGSDGQCRGAYDYVANLPSEFYHYYHGSNTDMGTLIEVRRSWDAYIRHGGSRIPGHWVQPPPPADKIWASYLVQPK